VCVKCGSGAEVSRPQTPRPTPFTRPPHGTAFPSLSSHTCRKADSLPLSRSIGVDVVVAEAVERTSRAARQTQPI